MGADTVILARGLVKRFGATIALAGPPPARGGGGAGPRAGGGNCVEEG